ncbi:MAG: ABC transporter permease [Dyella sp.]
MGLVYSLQLAIAGGCRNPRNSALAAITVAVGLAACMTTLTLLHVLSADPLPGRSQNLYLAWVDTVQAKHEDYHSLNGVKYLDYRLIKTDAAKTLLDAHRATRQTVVAGLQVDVGTDDSRREQKGQDLLATSADFAPMFGLALRYGRPWSQEEDRTRARVALIDVGLAQQLFGTPNAVDRLIRVKGSLFRVIGVVAHFAPSPHFYGLDRWSFDAKRHETVFLPYSAALEVGLDNFNQDRCDASVSEAPIHADLARCSWLMAWVQLENAQQVSDYRQYLNHLNEQTPRSQAFGKAEPAQLIRTDEWLGMQQVVPDTVRLNVWLAGSFLLLCLVNVAGLLTAKFLSRGSEIGIRRALGAPRRAVFAQHVLEACTVCLAGGVLALPLTLGGLWILRQQADSFSALARLDLGMFTTLFALALGLGVLVGLLPAWRASMVQPGLQVKSA